MKNRRIKKIVGKISDEVVDRYHLYDYRNREIIQSLDLYIHVAKHASEFKNIDSFNHTLSNISDVISFPFFVYYDSHRNSLLYFKEIDENVCVVVKLKLRESKDCYVATIYPISKNKIQKYIEQSYIVNR